MYMHYRPQDLAPKKRKQIRQVIAGHFRTRKTELDNKVHGRNAWYDNSWSKASFRQAHDGNNDMHIVITPRRVVAM